MSHVGDVRDFDRLTALVRVEGRLVNETPLRVGVGREAPLGSAVDLVVYRVNGNPCIPGSSLKGVFRNFVEQLARSDYPNLHTPWEFEKIDEEEKERNFCVLCGLFGSTKLASHVRVYDAYPLGEPKTTIKTSVSIDREFGGARPGLLFTEEIVEPGYSWSFKLDAINIPLPPEQPRPDARSELLWSLLRALKDFGLQVGARRSVGEGLIRLTEARWKRYLVENGRLNKKEEGVF